MSTTVKTVVGILVIAIIVVLAVTLRHRDAAAPAPAASTQDSSLSSTAAGSATRTATTTKPMDQHYTQAAIKTNMGDFTITFDSSIAPNTVENFVKLASSGFYNGIKFHRIIAGFMIQGGDPLTKDDSKVQMWGTGGPGYQFDDEITPKSKNIVGAVAMANSGPNTNGSQFFVNVADNSYLDGHYSVFGHVTSGYDVVEKISKVKTVPGDRPVDPVIINSVVLK